MTCKDCFHGDVCEGYIPTDLDRDIWHYCREGKADQIPDIEQRCPSFKDRTKYMEVVRCKDREHWLKDLAECTESIGRCATASPLPDSVPTEKGETMDSVKKNLMEILREPIFPHELVDPIEAVADYLLDNDVVPVVRCKDCKWGTTPYGDERDGWTECTNLCGRPLMRDEGFCYQGERGKQ